MHPPTYYLLPICLPTYLPTIHLLTYLPTYYPLVYLPTYLLPTCLPTYLPSRAPTHPPNLFTYPFTHLLTYLPIFHFLFPISYNLSIILQLATYFIVLYWYEINMTNKKLDQNWTPFDLVVIKKDLVYHLWRWKVQFLILATYMHSKRLRYID
jgi:hypothetical protein